ncbi:MAG: ExbD/TolR family protein [Gemmataceae bacterium]
MAEKRRFLDVWIVESNTVYKEVPFLVVADWVQQGRLLEDDMIKPSGTAKWFAIGKTPALAAYLPREEPFRVEDQAEALDPVRLDFAWKRRPGDEDDDVDMIPLIDISLVLLIFFMMTTTAVLAGSGILTPNVLHGFYLDANPSNFWIGIDLVDERPIYSIGEGENAAAETDRNLTEEEAVKRLAERLANIRQPVEVRIAAHRHLKYEVVRNLTIKIEPFRFAGKVRKITTEVSEAES